VIDWDPRVNEIFLKAIEAGSPAGRAAILDESCRDSAELRRKVEALLEAHDQLGSFLERPSREEVVAAAGTGETPTIDAEDGGPHLARPEMARAETSTDAGVPLHLPLVESPRSEVAIPPIEGIGSLIGPYKLLEQIGEGGMGYVFLAEQEKPVRRKVALKLIKPGMDSAQVIARFEAERQALAMMDHPNIARVLEAGTTAAGRPYFVMELVKGVPLTQFCDDRRLTPAQRLELMIPVCQAVQHAHQKGVIHRDLKPSNVLVALYDGVPIPKVIDFGIAKAIGQKLTEATLHTGFGAIVGTLAYMSPEQAELNQLDIDTRSDVYSLGVILYELLTGTTPLDRRHLGLAALLEALRVIREEEPPRPSTRLSTTEELPSIAANRGIEPRKLSALVRGDLDWIVMKALEKDRKARYETASALAQDVRRYLDGDPVEACPPSRGYRLRKFARRHRRGLTAAGIFAAVLVGATAVSTWQAIRATRAERQAVEAAAIERMTTAFFINDLLGGADLDLQAISELRPDPDLKVRTLVDLAAGQIEGKFAGRPLVEAAVRQRLGTVYRTLGLPAQSRPQHERAYELRRGTLGEDHPDTIASERHVSQAEVDLALYDQAEARCRRVLERAVRRDGEGSRSADLAEQSLAFCLIRSGRFVEAEGYLRRFLARDHGTSAEARTRRISAKSNLALVLSSRGSMSEAEALREEALQDAQRFPGEHPTIPNLRIGLAHGQTLRGQFVEADRNAREAVRLSRKLFGDRHPITLSSQSTYGDNLLAWGKIDQAEVVLRARFDTAREAFGGESAQAIQAALDLSAVLVRQRRWAEAELMLRQIYEPAKRIGHELAGFVDKALGELHSQMGRLELAEQELMRAESDFADSRSGAIVSLIGVKNDLALVYTRMGRPAQAVNKRREALSLCEKHLIGDHDSTFAALGMLASACRVAGRLDEAEALFPRAIAMGLRLYGPGHEKVLANQINFGALLHVRGRFEQAETQYREALDGHRRSPHSDKPNLWVAVSNLGELYRDWGRYDQAESALTEALEGQQKDFGLGHTATLWTLWKIAEMDRDRGRYPEAVAKFLRCLEGYAKVQKPESLDLATLEADLGLTHLKAGAPGKAEPLFREALRVYDKEMPDDWRRFEIRSQLGEALATQKHFAEAEPLLLEGYEGMIARRKDVTVDAWPRRPDPGRRVVRLYDEWGKPEKAAEWRERIKADGGTG
jgi:serine/threonine protein kinase/tetratricopeptide (TPR) repeat protein